MKKVFISRQPAPLRLARPGRRVSPACAGRLWLIFLFLLLTGCGVKKDISQPKNYMPTAKILMVVAPRDFRDVEYNEPRKIFEEAGAQVKVASIQTGTATGAEGTKVNIDLIGCI